jgi:oligopeptide transport system ATP-binding protein
MKPLVSLRNLKVHFPVHAGFLFRRQTGAVRAVDGVSLDIMPGETVGLVGESGCGKSTTGRAILQLYPPAVAEVSGEVHYDGRDLVDLARLGESALRPLRRDLQIIFQDPYASLNPRMTVGATLAEPLRIHRLAAGSALTARVDELLETVGLSPAMARRYPHEFSGGQRQRIGIARALAVRPKFIVCDEPISALDVSIQAQVMNLMADLQERFSLTYLFIAHDLAAVKHISDRIAVMYLGRIAELGPADAVYEAPLHPYTQALISAVPVPDPSQRDKRRIALEGELPSPLSPPSGCRFHPRCRYAEPDCKLMEPELAEVSPGRFVACHPVARGARFTIREKPPELS